jgi:hypothetical protein
LPSITLHQKYAEIIDRFLLSVAIAIPVFVFSAILPRELTILSVSAFYISLLYWTITRKSNWVVYTFLLFEIVTFSGVDVMHNSFETNYPKIYRYVRGLPTPASIEAEKRGEVWLAGCCGRGIPPKWLIVW